LEGQIFLAKVGHFNLALRLNLWKDDCNVIQVNEKSSRKSKHADHHEKREKELHVYNLGFINWKRAHSNI